ncbi:MAG: hypothetical protein IH958_03175 [Chloroflexi bacterium]|nr:hypothetical protein [Chloroflexota bacterium]
MARLLISACILAFAFAGFGQLAGAQQPVEFEVTIEPASATVGDRLTLTIVASHAAGAQLEAPLDPDAFAPLELVAVRPPVTRDAGGGREETRLVYILAAFQTGELQPPPIEVAVRGEDDASILLQPPAVTIKSVLPEDGPIELRGIQEPLAASTGAPRWIWAALLMAGFTALTVVTMVFIRLPVRETPTPVSAPPPPARPEEAARQELDAIADAALLDRGDEKEYYRRIGACVRRYLSARFAIPATAMTSQELEARLREPQIDRWPARLAANLLRQSEAVQFAQYQPARERAEADLSSAYQVVQLTTEPEPAAAGADLP